MGLTEYRRKRDFRVTPEPKGVKGKRHKDLEFVVQKHAASHLHYDFRLELDGVLKSWAVPKGPSLNPSDKRLAMHVEDHPLQYGSFEGIIPAGEYGGGTVMLWDRGTWEPVGDPKTGYREGKLKFHLHGEKLRGGWMLVRRRGKSAETEERAWFLIKERDEEAQPDVEIAKQEPLSVATGRDLDEIAADKDRVWGSKSKPAKKTAKAATRRAVAVKKTAKAATRRAAAVKKTTVRARKKSKKKQPTRKNRNLDELPGVRSGKLKTFQPQLAMLVKQAPDGDQWLHEIKFDGYRMLARVEGGRAEMISRNDKSWTERLKPIAEAVAELPVDQALLDGEVVTLLPDGTTNFQALQNVFSDQKVDELLYYVFDVLHLDGKDLTGVPLEDRKAVLADFVPNSKDGVIRLSEHIAGDGPEFFGEACKLGLEGIISKRRDRPYVAGRGPDWLKVKCSQREEFVIGGFTKPSGQRSGFGALLLGYHNSQRELVYAGRVGTGFSDRTLDELHKRLKKLEQKTSPFVNLSGNTGQARDVHWVKPQLVGQVEFSNWTQDNILRHPSFQGLREDKPASQVVREEALPTAAVVAKNGQAMKRSTKKPPSPSKAKSSRGAAGKASVGKAAGNHADAADAFAGVRLTHPEKILYPDQGITKQELAEYYLSVADWIMPHLMDRPLSIVRCPAGQKKHCFYQKHAEGAPENLGRVAVREKDGTSDYLVVKDIGGVISLVQMGVLEIHVWGSKADKQDLPDRLVFDLDPDAAVPWPKVVAAARAVCGLLDELGLESFAKTTGGKGLHVVVPIQRRTSWDEAKEFCRAVSLRFVELDPSLYLATMSKAARKGKIFIDYFRNDAGATSVAAYSTRSRSGAPVSTPVQWDELGANLKSDQFNVRNLPKRLAKLKQDPWATINDVRQSITAAMKKRVGL